MQQPLVATIGFFDGVHLGHQQVLKRLVDTAHANNYQSMVITFAEHPKPDMMLLNSLSERKARILSNGVDTIDILDFGSIRHLTAQEFMHNVLRGSLHIKMLLMGYDHRFGSDQIIDFRSYQAIGEKEGINVVCLPQFAPHGMHISSSAIRNLLEIGDVDGANEMLGYQYGISGVVVEGKQIGRQLGFPTANILPTDKKKIIPGAGAYIVDVECNKWQGRIRGMLNIGSNPTFGGEKNTIEVHLLNYSADLYDATLRITFLHRLRGELKFLNAEALRQQLEHDKTLASQYPSKL